MQTKSYFAEAWMQLAGGGLLILAAFMMLAPFLVSLVANFGRREVGNT